MRSRTFDKRKDKIDSQNAVNPHTEFPSILAPDETGKEIPETIGAKPKSSAPTPWPIPPVRSITSVKTMSHPRRLGPK